MMNSKRVQSFVDPVPQSKRPRLDGTIGTSGLSKANSLPQYTQDKSLPYRHTYLPCSLGGQETLDLPTAWSPSRIFVRNGGSPVVHSTTTEGSIINPVIYRPENVNFHEDSDSATVAEDVVMKQKLACCTGSPSKHSPSSMGLISPDPFRKIPIGCTSLSSSTVEKSGGLAIPKPVYGHSPCCTGQKCTRGRSYYVDNGLQRMIPQMFEDGRMTYYGHWACMHKKESEALMQQRLSFQHGGERILLKDTNTEGYHGLSPNKPQRVSAFSDPRQSKYMYNHIHPIVPSSPDHCQPFQMPRQAHKDLGPMYEPVCGMQYETHMPIYRDCPHTSKYRDIPQPSLLYCSKNNPGLGLPNPNTEYFQQTSEQRPIFQPFLRDLKNPYIMVPPDHAVVRNISAYPAYRTQFNTRHLNPFNKRQFCPADMQYVEQPLDFSMQKEQDVDSNKEQLTKGQHGIKGTFHQNEPQAHYKVSSNLLIENSSLDSPYQGQNNYLFNNHKCRTPSTGTGDVFNKKQSLCLSDKAGNGVLSKKHMVEAVKSCENYSVVKAQTVPQQKTIKTKDPSLSPMPVINKVFSLAPYKAYLEATGMLSPAQDPGCPVPEPDSNSPKNEPDVQNTDPETNLDKDVFELKIKTEKAEHDESVCQSEKEHHNPVISQNKQNVNVKEEQDNLESTEGDVEHNHVIKRGCYSGSKSVTPEMPERPLEHTVACGVTDGVAVPSGKKQSDHSAPLCDKPPILTQTNQTTFSLNNIPPHFLKLTSFKIILPEDFKTSVSPVPEALRSPVENKVAINSREARYQFMELHQSLCALVSGCISQTSHCELRNWLSRIDLDVSTSPPAKPQKVSCLLGSKAREVWMKNADTMRALQNVLYQLENYVRIQECPFPHVIRAGAVFIPMLVVKEVLFPQVPGTYIDQVLQEHRVELRPTTLSEERQLTQLHKQAFSSKLRRLLSLKHLPDIYSDVLNLLYYADVCKFLGIEVNSTFKRECAQWSDEAESSFNGYDVHYISSRSQTPDISTCMGNLKQPNGQESVKSKGRVKGACKRRFLGDDTSSEEDEPAVKTESWIFSSCLEVEGWEYTPAACTNEEALVEVKIESDAEREPENSWGRPLTSDDLSSESTDVETEETSWSSYASHEPSSVKKRSDMVLKLRKVYYHKGRGGQVSHYQRIPDKSEAQRERHRRCRRKKKRRKSMSSMQHRVRKISSRSQHCSCLSDQCTSEHRTWVLRSATQNTLEDMRNRYPDLVGKRIRHLYEENDKTEVWYKGVVLRIHESHSNPLKTVFEVKYDSEPEWQYYLELLMDYKKGWLQIED